MFPYYGILADEEPKTAISPNGLYNSSDLSGSRHTLSSQPLSGLSEFTFMVWVNTDFSQSVVTPYLEADIQFIAPLFIRTDKVLVDIGNSNGGKTYINHTVSTSSNTWYHFAVTGSVSNNRVRLYRDGVLLTSAVMTYSNTTTTNKWFTILFRIRHLQKVLIHLGTSAGFATRISKRCFQCFHNVTFVRAL